jgi:hypothetical protein
VRTAWESKSNICLLWTGSLAQKRFPAVPKAPEMKMLAQNNKRSDAKHKTRAAKKLKTRALSHSTESAVIGYERKYCC